MNCGARFVLCFVVLRGAVIAEKDNESFGMAIAFSVVAGGYAGGSISGGCFNPAVAIGLDVSSAHLNGRGERPQAARSC